MRTSDFRLYAFMIITALVGSARAETPDPYLEWLKNQPPAPTQATPQAQPQQPQPAPPSNAPPSRHAQAVDYGDFVATYLPAVRFGEMQNELRKARLIDNWADALNEHIALPTNVQIAYGECNTPNAFYSPDTRRITLCYELLTYYSQQVEQMGLDAAEKESVFASMILFVFFHELGHALIDVLDLSFTGREEDAADQLSTYMMLAAGVNSLSPIYFGIEQYISRPELNDQVYADEHAFGPQRFFNIMCWVYGSGTMSQAAAAETEKLLPPGRKAKCPGEFRKLINGWDALLARHMKE